MTAPNAAPSQRTIQHNVGAVAAGSDATSILGVCGEDETITAVTYIPVTTLTGANTDTRTLTVVNKGAAGSGSTSVATGTYVSGTNATALKENALVLSGTPANLQTSAGDVLVLTSVHSGSTGLADPGGQVRVTLTRR